MATPETVVDTFKQRLRGQFRFFRNREHLNIVLASGCLLGAVLVVVIMVAVSVDTLQLDPLIMWALVGIACGCVCTAVIFLLAFFFTRKTDAVALDLVAVPAPNAAAA